MCPLLGRLSRHFPETLHKSKHHWDRKGGEKIGQKLLIVFKAYFCLFNFNYIY